MRWVVVISIHIATGDRWSHPVVGEDEVDPAFIGVFVRFASGLFSRFAVAFAFIIAYVNPPMLFDESHCNWESFEVPV